MFHLALHLLAPALVACIFSQKRWKHAYVVMITTMLVDLDHLLANPIYDPNRCSIGFHTLHHPILALMYIALCFVPKTRLIGVGLTIHMCLDSIDCQITNGIWFL